MDEISDKGQLDGFLRLMEFGRGFSSTPDRCGHAIVSISI